MGRRPSLSESERSRALRSRLSRRAAVRGIVAAGLAGAVPLRLATAARAAPGDFFAGKTITVICGYNPGGGVDIGTRLIARHLGRFLPGDARAIVKNMQGASGIVAANHLYVKAAPDGLTLAVPGRDWVPKPALGHPNAQFDPIRFGYVGSTGGTATIGWLRADLGIRSPQDLKDYRGGRPVIFGGLPQSTMLSSVPKLLQDLGLPVTVILGYENTARIVLAIEQTELDAIYTPETSLAHRRDLIYNKVLVPVFQSQPALPGVALVNALVPAPQRPLLDLIHASATFGMPLVAPPDMPAERLAVLRAAFLAMANDPVFQQDAASVGEPVGAPIGGARLTDMVASLVKTITPDTARAFRRLTGE
jgi:hypothetical protein